MNISLIILNYNGLNDTLACLESLEVVEADNNSLETIVVDNNSSDGSQEALSMIKNIIFIKNDKNFGFSGGNNTGIKYALNKGSDFVILLNNDTIVEKSFVKNLVRAANKADIISPKIYFAKGYEFHKKRYSEKDLGKVIWYAGGKIDWQNVIGKHVGVDAVDKGQFSKSAITDFATGACMLVKREVFEKIGFFDEKYFLYLEDMDLCVRAKKAGFKILFEPRAAIWHKNAASIGGSGSSLQDYYFTKSRLLFAFKFAKFRTKLAVLKEVIASGNRIKRRAVIDFFTLNFKEVIIN